MLLACTCAMPQYWEYLASAGTLDSGLPDVPDFIAVALNRHETNDWTGSSLAGLQMRRHMNPFALSRVR